MRAPDDGSTTPDIMILGQITVDHVVPASQGSWFERLGGNAIYAASGARLWCDPARIGIVARRGANIPASLDAMLRNAGLGTGGLVPMSVENMVEWLIYETDGSRRNLPRAPELRDTRVDDRTRHARYLAYKHSVSANYEDIPAAWLPATAVHLAPQVGDRHRRSLAALADRAALRSVDPSPTYSRTMSLPELAASLAGATVLLPSQGEVDHLAADGDWAALARALGEASGAEVVLKLGAGGVVLRTASGAVHAVPAAPAQPRDFTGAGDAFCGAYLACRAQGLPPEQAARRGVVAAAMVIECAGVDAALELSAREAERRLHGAFGEPVVKGALLACPHEN